jgi:hypothetical protein
MSKAGGWVAFLAVVGMAADIQAQEGWTAPFGGT